RRRRRSRSAVPSRTLPTRTAVERCTRSSDRVCRRHEVHPAPRRIRRSAGFAPLRTGREPRLPSTGGALYLQPSGGSVTSNPSFMKSLFLLGFAAAAVALLCGTALAHDRWHHHHVRADVHREVHEAMREARQAVQEAQREAAHASREARIAARDAYRDTVRDAARDARRA